MLAVAHRVENENRKSSGDQWAALSFGHSVVPSLNQMTKQRNTTQRNVNVATQRAQTSSSYVINYYKNDGKERNATTARSLDQRASSFLLSPAK